MSDSIGFDPVSYFHWACLTLFNRIDEMVDTEEMDEESASARVGFTPDMVIAMRGILVSKGWYFDMRPEQAKVRRAVQTALKAALAGHLPWLSSKDLHAKVNV